MFAVVIPGLISLLRILSIHKFYHAPFDILHHFEYHSVPSILESHGYSPVPLPDNYVPYRGEIPAPDWDYAPLQNLEPRVKLCYGAEWHRFPSNYLVPEGIEVRFLQTEFDGMIPRPWTPSANTSTSIWPRPETRVIHPGRFNGDNKASLESGAYVDVKECTYLVDLDLPSKQETRLEPRWKSRDGQWEEEFCKPFLDAEGSYRWSRLLWLPWGIGGSGRTWGQYCLLKRK
jgi:alpha-1,2-mannosyltransferase